MSKQNGTIIGQECDQSTERHRRNCVNSLFGGSEYPVKNRDSRRNDSEPEEWKEAQQRQLQCTDCSGRGN